MLLVKIAVQNRAFILVKLNWPNMKHSFESVFAACLLLLCVSCEKHHAIEIEKVTGFTTSMLTNGAGLVYESVREVHLEESDESVLSGIVGVAFMDSFLLVQDYDKLVCFHSDGRFYSRIGQRGHGHGEYLRINAFMVDSVKHTVSIVDESLSQLITFTLAGDHVNTVPLEREWIYMLHNIHPMANDTYLVEHYFYNSFNSLYQVLALGENGGVSDLLSMPFQTENTAEMFGRNPVSGYGGRLSLLKPFDAYVYHYVDGKLIPYLFVESDMKQLSGKQLSKINKFSFMDVVNKMDNGYFPGFTSIYETDNFLYLDICGYCYFLIDKSRMVGRMFDSGSNSSSDEDNGPMPMLKVCASDGHSFVGVRNRYDGSNPSLLFYRVQSMAITDSAK